MHRLTNSSLVSRRLVSLVISLSLTVVGLLILTAFTHLNGHLSIPAPHYELDHGEHESPQVQYQYHPRDAGIDYLLRKNGHGPQKPLVNTGKGLGVEDFAPHKGYFHHDSNDFLRFESVDAWRTPDSYEPSYVVSENRPKLPPLSDFRSKGEYLKQPLIADYAPGSESVFFMVKEGASVLWDRLPLHFLTTLTRIPKFALYSDAPGSIVGYEVVDVLANVTKETFESPEFEMYRLQKYLHDSHGIADPAHLRVKGGWQLDRFKNIPMLAHAYSVSPQSDWFIFMDGDSYFFMDNVMAYLRTLDPEVPMYMGSAAMLAGDLFAHGGSGVILSRKAVEETVGKHPEYVQEYEERTFDYCCGDYMVALMLKEKLGIAVENDFESPEEGFQFQGNSFWDLEITNEKWCRPIFSFHHLSPHDLGIIWEYERLLGPNAKHITYGSMYRDFYLPYITEEMENWDNGADEVFFSLEKDREDEADPDADSPPKDITRPWESKQICKRTCELLGSCYMWRFLPHAQYCGLSTMIKLGKAAYEWIELEKDQLDNREARSGWVVDRIRNMRLNQTCDPLYYNPSYDTSPIDRTEGWYRRQYAAELQNSSSKLKM